MSTSIRWDGLEELKAALRNLPEELAGEAGHIVEAEANGAAVDVARAYQAHVLTGELAGHVSVTHFERGRFSAGAIVKNTSKLAWIFEEGSDARHYITVKGNTHVTGRMPAFHVFVPTIQRARQRMYDQLRDLLKRHGLLVTG